MLEPYLNKQNKEEETSTLEAGFELSGETIKDMIPINKEKYMLLMESGSSLVVFTAGAFTIYTIKKTKEILEDLIEKSKTISITYSKSIQALKLFKDDADTTNQQKNQQSKTGGEE